MAAVTLTTVVDLSKVKMKWQEQYVSEGLNRKVIPASPKGIYRGLFLVQNITSPRLVDVQGGADGRHEAVHQSVDGFSMSYFDAVGTTATLDLSNAALSSTETVIALQIVYEIGIATTANWIAYPITDWNALSLAAQGEFIVLGTINVPAPATNITTAMILPKRRTAAWEKAAPGATPWSPIIRNPSFEHGVTAADTVPYSISDWVNRSDLAVNGSFRLGTSTVRSGAKSLEFNKSAVGAGVGRIEQYQEVPVTPGQLVHVTGWVRQLIAPTAGSYTFNLYWGDLNSTASTSTVVTASVLSTTDASYRLVDLIFAVPASVYVLKTVTIEAAGLTTGSTGIALVVDDFQVHVETGSPQAIQSAINGRLKQQMTSALLVEDPSTYALGQLAALLRFDKSTPASEGELIVDRKDQDYSVGLPPALSLLGRLINVGSRLLSTSVNSEKARISTPYSPSLDVTLIWESLPSTGTHPAIRIYISLSGLLFITQNAFYTNSDGFWHKDVAGTISTLWDMKRGYLEQFAMVADAPWANWTQISKMSVSQATTQTNQQFSPLLELFDSGGTRRVAFDHLGLRGGRYTEYCPPWLTATPTGFVASQTGTGVAPALISYRPGDIKPSIYGLNLVVNVGVGTSNLFMTSGIYALQSLGPQILSPDACVAMEWESYGNLSGASDMRFVGGITNGTNGAHFKLDPSIDNNWRLITNAIGSDAGTTTVNTGVVYGVSVNQRFRLEVYGSNLPGGARVEGYINGVLVGESTAHLPDIDLAPYFQLSRPAGTGIQRNQVISPISIRAPRTTSDDAL